jgi:hypothetical protein
MSFPLSPPLALLALVAASAMNGPAPAMAEEPAAARIAIEYVPPKSPALQEIYTLLRQRQALEKVQAAFSPFRLPMDVTIRTFECGVSNAWYQPIDHRPTVTLCYEYLRDIWEALPKETTEAGITPVDALAGQFFFAAAHEFGHLSFDVYDIAIFGREEEAADNFATYIMLQLREDAHRLIAGAAYSYHHILTDDRQQGAKATLRLAAFSSNHGQPEERFFNLLCIAYGSDDKRFADVVEKKYLPETRAKDCKYEFEGLQRAFRKEISPHIDKDKAAEVMKRDWLAGIAPPPPLR